MINLGYFSEEIDWMWTLDSQTSSKKFLVNWLGLTGHVAKGGNFSGEID
jgi:hypothetical protein